MNISTSDLRVQFTAARARWPFIDRVEARHNLPALLLYAVGSRETNLRNLIGDGGHGFGVWQRDNRSFHVDASYLDDVTRQAEDAATLLVANHQALGDWSAACAAYNAGVGGVRHALAQGRSADSATTGRDYGADVMARMRTLQLAFPPVTPSAGIPVAPTAPAAPAHLAVPSSGAGHPVIVVQPGDTLSELALEHGTTVARLVSLNHIADPDLIFVGQHLVLA